MSREVPHIGSHSENEIKPHTKESLLLILDIMIRFSSPQNILTREQLNDLLDKHYNVTYDVKTLNRNLKTLDALSDVTGYKLSIDRRGVYVKERPFTPAELQMVSTSIIFSKEISKRLSGKLIEKLGLLFGGPDFKPEYKNISSMPESSCINQDELKKNIGIISQAIRKKKQISFSYGSYDKNKELQIKGSIDMPKIINPYHILANNGRYYLLCNYPAYADQAYLRIDKMRNVMLCKTKRTRLLRELKGDDLDDRTDLSKHAAEHIYMFSGAAEDIKLKVSPPSAIDAVADWFGKDFSVVPDNNPDYYIVRVKCNKKAMLYWALQYGSVVEVLSPQDLREEIKNTVTNIYKKYR